MDLKQIGMVAQHVIVSIRVRWCHFALYGTQTCIFYKQPFFTSISFRLGNENF